VEKISNHSQLKENGKSCGADSIGEYLFAKDKQIGAFRFFIALVVFKKYSKNTKVIISSK